MTVIKEKAYAKINLYLDVTNKREDGFHDISTIMHSVSLCDEMTVILDRNKRGSQISMTVDGNRWLPCDSRNIAYEAARIFLEQVATSANITLKLKKRIPVAAGLAGGSSDAAAVLRALNKIFKRPLSDRALSDLAARLGSDVPYCLLGGTALCEGRGEKMRTVSTKRRLYSVIAIANGEYISTPRAYAALDDLYDDFKNGTKDVGGVRLSEVSDFLAGGCYPKGGLYNIFEAAVLPSCQGATLLKTEMIRLGAYGSLMSGSGPSVFGLFESSELARRAEIALRAHGIKAYYAESV